MSDIISALLEKTPFSQLSYENKLQMVQRGRPQPTLPGLTTEHKEKNRSYTRCFNVSNYKKYIWLTGSSGSNKLYCWPCLLFSTETSPWKKTGFNSLNNLVKACDKHQKSLGHIRAFTALQKFGSQRIPHSLNKQKKIADNLHNEKVKENRTILRRLIDLVTFLGKQKCAFRSQNESKDSTNKGMYIELMQFLATYDSILTNHLKTGTVFSSMTPEIQNDLIDAVSSVITDQIKSEIAKTSFVAILLDETADVTNKSRLSTVLRYVDGEGNCQERFLHFTDVSLDRTARGLLQHITKVVNDVGCSKKVVAQSFDGAAVMAGHMSGLQTLLKIEYPTATFINYYCHRLNSVLSKSTNCIKECNGFFVALSGISRFFSHSSLRTSALKNFMERKLPGGLSTLWNFSSRLVNTVKNYRVYLINFFSSIEDEPGNWRGEEVNTASGFVRFLSKFETKFFLIMFNKIFEFSDVLFDILQNNCMDISYCANKVSEFYDTLKKIKYEDFEEVWTETRSHDEGEENYEFYETLGRIKVEDFDTVWTEVRSIDEAEVAEPRPKRQRNDYDSFKYLSIFNQILDTLMIQTQLRFKSLKYLKFVSLLDSNYFDKFCESFPDHLLSELQEPYISNFGKIRLKNELRVFYSLEEYKNKSVRDITCYMKLNKFDIVFSEVYKLAELILTFPSTNVTTEINFSALNRIKNYLKATQEQVYVSNLAVLSIEKNILLDLKRYSEETFYETVTFNFTQKEKRMELTYR